MYKKAIKFRGWLFKINLIIIKYYRVISLINYHVLKKNKKSVDTNLNFRYYIHCRVAR